MDVRAVRDEIAAELDRASPTSVESARRVRRHWSRQLETEAAADVVALARLLADRHGWVAYELVNQHPDALACLTAADLESLAGKLDSWGRVDAFSRYVAGPAWRLGAIGD